MERYIFWRDYRATERERERRAALDSLEGKRVDALMHDMLVAGRGMTSLAVSC
jgi:hypothetical protein